MLEILAFGMLFESLSWHASKNLPRVNYQVSTYNVVFILWDGVRLPRVNSFIHTGLRFESEICMQILH